MLNFDGEPERTRTPASASGGLRSIQLSYRFIPQKIIPHFSEEEKTPRERSVFFYQVAEASAMVSMLSFMAASKSSSLMEAVRPSERAREKLAMTPWFSESFTQESARL